MLYCTISYDIVLYGTLLHIICRVPLVDAPEDGSLEHRPGQAVSVRPVLILHNNNTNYYVTTTTNNKNNNDNNHNPDNNQ